MFRPTLQDARARDIPVITWTGCFYYDLLQIGHIVNNWHREMASPEKREWESFNTLDCSLRRMRSFYLFLSFALVIALFAAGCTTNPVQPQPAQTTSVPTPAVTQPPVTVTSVPTSQPPSSASALTGTWYLQAILYQGATAPLDANTQITATFDNQGQVSGYGGCNNYGGPYTITGQNLPSGTGISIGPLISTRMYCTATSSTEQSYLAILGTAVSYTVFPNQKMSITDRLGNSLSFSRIPYSSPTSVPSF
jgi:heat shock protein HslJ